MKISKVSRCSTGKFSTSEAMIRWPVDDTGRNSVAPSTMPSTTAFSHTTMRPSSLQPGRQLDPERRPLLRRRRLDGGREQEMDIAVIPARAGWRVAVEEADVARLLQAPIAAQGDARRAAGDGEA